MTMVALLMRKAVRAKDESLRARHGRCLGMSLVPVPSAEVKDGGGVWKPARGVHVFLHQLHKRVAQLSMACGSGQKKPPIM